VAAPRWHDLVVDPEVVSGGSRRGGKAGVAFAFGVVALLVMLPACSSPSTPSAVTTSTTTSTSSPVTVPNQSPAEVAACQSDANSLTVALEAYMAQKGAFPTPSSPWSAATYSSNFAPLVGQYMARAPATTSYVIEYDSAGHVWVAPPGSYGATYNPGQDFSANPNVCLPAVG